MSKFKLGISTATVERLKIALEQDASILTDKVGLEKHEGNSEAYLLSLGLSKGDLRRLEASGIAIRGYTKNIWLPGEQTPRGITVPVGQRYVGRGHHARWVLVITEEMKWVSSAEEKASATSTGSVI